MTRLHATPTAVRWHGSQHGAGSCGAAAWTGAAHTFFSGETDKARAGELINVLREAQQPVPEALLAFGTTVKKKESKLYGAHFKVGLPSRERSRGSPSVKALLVFCNLVMAATLMSQGVAKTAMMRPNVRQ